MVTRSQLLLFAFLAISLVLQRCNGQSTGDLTVMIVGGYNDFADEDLDSVEVVVLSSESEATIREVSDCASPHKLPYKINGNVGISDANGWPMTCGGSMNILDVPTKNCLIYSRDADMWIPGPSMNEYRDFAATVPLSNGNYLIVGGWTSGYQSYEFYDTASGAFVAGKHPLLFPVSAGCAVEVEPGLVFIADQTRAAYLDVETESFTALPAWPVEHNEIICGVAASAQGDGGKDVVVWGGYEDELQIFNTETQEWRLSESEFSHEFAATVQFGDTFITIGGGTTDDIRRDVYEYRADNDTMVIRTEKMLVPRSTHAAIVVDADYCLPKN